MLNLLQYSSLIALLVLFNKVTFSQEKELSDELKIAIETPRLARILFYNCENLFDTKDDSLTSDEEFLPSGDRNWSQKRYNEKSNRIAKVITAVGGWKPPELVGLCEIENRSVLNYLTKSTPLYAFNYKIIHKESPDARGIDVALLYQPKSFNVVDTKFIPIKYPFTDRKTRDILYAKGLLTNGDTLHVFVNHWPSRYGGQLESEENRFFVASVLKSVTDSLIASNSSSLITIVGDFNDEPNNQSLLKVLDAKPQYDSLRNPQLINLSYRLQFEKNQGSYKYQSHWGILDQLIVSGNLLAGREKTFTTIEHAFIYIAPFLMEPDDTYLGEKPFRTFTGFKYNNGFSDHLPVFIDLLEK
ncbi:MAG: endonuclease [Salinivirgaceae bacterium]|jgi:predicted extracellular nuclease